MTHQDPNSVEDLLVRVDQRSGYVYENYDFERNPFGRLRIPEKDEDDIFGGGEFDDTSNGPM